MILCDKDPTHTRFHAMQVSFSLFWLSSTSHSGTVASFHTPSPSLSSRRRWLRWAVTPAGQRPHPRHILLLSSTCSVSHTEKSFWLIALWESPYGSKNIILFLSNFVSTKKMGTDDMIAWQAVSKKSVKDTVKSNFMLSCLLYVDTTLVHPWNTFRKPLFLKATFKKTTSLEAKYKET